MATSKDDNLDFKPFVDIKADPMSVCMVLWAMCALTCPILGALILSVAVNRHWILILMGTVLLVCGLCCCVIVAHYFIDPCKSKIEVGYAIKDDKEIIMVKKTDCPCLPGGGCWVMTDPNDKDKVNIGLDEHEVDNADGKTIGTFGDVYIDTGIDGKYRKIQIKHAKVEHAKKIASRYNLMLKDAKRKEDIVTIQASV